MSTWPHQELPNKTTTCILEQMHSRLTKQCLQKFENLHLLFSLPRWSGGYNLNVSFRSNDKALANIVIKNQDDTISVLRPSFPDDVFLVEWQQELRANYRTNVSVRFSIWLGYLERILSIHTCSHRTSPNERQRWDNYRYGVLWNASCGSNGQGVPKQNNQEEVWRTIPKRNYQPQEQRLVFYSRAMACLMGMQQPHLGYIWKISSRTMTLWDFYNTEKFAECAIQSTITSSYR